MGQLFTITDDIREIARKAFSDLITELGKDCRLYYPASQSECSNCYYNSQTGRSSGKYKVGGPIPFSLGMVCPVCGGVGLEETQNTEVIRLLLNKNPKTFENYDIKNVRVPLVDVQTKGFLTDLPKIQKCEYMVGQINLEGHIQEKYKLVGTPTDTMNIVQDKFFIANWARI